MTNSAIKANNRNISHIDDFLGKIQKAFTSAADIVLKKNNLRRNKSNLKKCKQQKRCNVNYQQIRKKLNLLERILTKNLNNHFLRAQYSNLERRYKGTCEKEAKM